jgi:hypothetical protein
MVRLFGDIASPSESIAAKERDDEENLLFIRNVGVGAHVERECALGHEVTEFGDFTGEFRRTGDFRVLSFRDWEMIERSG